MSQSVDRLKELLFDNEAQALGDLAKRIDAIADTDTRARDELGLRMDRQAQTDAVARDEINRRIEEVYSRAGNAERMTASVSEVISEALRRAEVSKHSELSQTIAPLVVTTIKTELRNSQDEMVEALYPITGRLVKSYVASAMKDLSDQMNRRLEQNPIMLRLQSLTTGRSVGDLALAGTQDFEVNELYLIRRGTGELIAHWPEMLISGREHAMSGVLSAVNEFANEAFSADQASLRHIDLGGEEVYLRGSPLYLLAARCSGQAPRSIEQTVDDALLFAVEKQNVIDATPGPAENIARAKSAALADVGQNLRSHIASQLEALRQPVGRGALKTLAAVILVPLLAWFGWSVYTDYRIAQVRATAERIITADSAMQGYPTSIDVTDRGHTLVLSGLTPSKQTKARVISELTKSLPRVNLYDHLNIVAGSGLSVPDVSPEFNKVREELADAKNQQAQLALERTHERTARQLQQAVLDLNAAASASSERTEADGLKRTAAQLDAFILEFKTLGNTFKTMSASNENANAIEKLEVLAQKLEGHAGEIIHAAGGDGRLGSAKTGKSPVFATDASLQSASDQLGALADRTAALAAAATLAKSLRPPNPPQPVAAGPALISPREQLEVWVRSHAIFFTTNTDYRNSETAAQLSGELAQLLASVPAMVRIVGYTDEVGAVTRNTRLAQERADKVRRDLINLGTDPSKIVAVGRPDGSDLSDIRGAMSPNRRVEFEIGFEGETQQ